MALDNRHMLLPLPVRFCLLPWPLVKVLQPLKGLVLQVKFCQPLKGLVPQARFCQPLKGLVPVVNHLMDQPNPCHPPKAMV